MATLAESSCFIDAPPIAAEVARGVTRLFCRQDLFAICEMPLPNGRRADMMAIDPKGGLTIVEIKVAKADLVGDGKWFDYLEYCDRFYWAVPPGLAGICEGERFLPGEAGLIVARAHVRGPEQVFLGLVHGHVLVVQGIEECTCVLHGVLTQCEREGGDQSIHPPPTTTSSW